MIDGKENEPPSENPWVKFVIDQDSEIPKVIECISPRPRLGGLDTKALIYRAIPAIAQLDGLPPEEYERQLKICIGQIYARHNNFNEADKRAAGDWERLSPDYFTKINAIFKGLPWPKGEYTATLSVIPPFRRFLYNKNFEVPFGPEEQRPRTTAHELTHFLFFEKVRTAYTPDLDNTVEQEMVKRLQGRFAIAIWEASELFNMVILTPERFGPCGNIPNPNVYKTLVSKTGEFAELWINSGEDIDEFFRRLEVKK